MNTLITLQECPYLFIGARFLMSENALSQPFLLNSKSLYYYKKDVFAQTHTCCIVCHIHIWQSVVNKITVYFGCFFFLPKLVTLPGDMTDIQSIFVE